MQRAHLVVATLCFVLPIGFVLAGGNKILQPSPRDPSLGTLYYYYAPC